MSLHANDRPSRPSHKLLFAGLMSATIGSASAAMAADTSGRMPLAGAGWIALAIIAAAVLIAWAMNARAAKIRALGTALAALACFAVILWFALALGTGIVEHPKPNQTPMDSAKPAILWMQAGVALTAGVILLLVALRQFRNTATLTLGLKNEPERYGRVSRALHWITAILFIALIPMGIFGSMIPPSAWFISHYFVVHKTIGTLVLVLLAARLLWNLQSKRPELDPTLKPVERRWAHRVHAALYLLMLAVPVTGYVMTSLHGYGTYLFAWELPSFLPKSKSYVFWGLFHKYLLPYLIYIVLGAHVLGALKHQLIDKHDSALKRMVG